MRAEVILVAVRSEEGLPLPFYAWVNNWLPHRPRQGGILAALIGARDRSTPRSGRVGAYLKSVAEAGHLHFILSQNQLADPALPLAPVNGSPHPLSVNGHARPALAARAAAR
jgi:hypothetical protein